MTKTLDRTRPHGTVHPPFNGAHFEQDGYSFDAQGRVVEALLTPAQKAALAKRAAPPRPPQTPPPHGQQAGAQTGAAAITGDEGGATDPNAKPEGVNVEQWLRDEGSANFLDIRKAVKDRFSVWETTKAGVVIFLVNEQKLISADELDPELRKLLPQSAG